MLRESRDVARADWHPFANQTHILYLALVTGWEKIPVRLEDSSILKSWSVDLFISS